MSEYSYDDRPRRRHYTREREREPREPEYVQETTYIERGGKGAPIRDLVYRGGRDDSIEDIPRDFPPPGAEYRQTRVKESYEPRRARSVNNRDYDYEDDYYPPPRTRGRRSYDRDGYYSDEYERPRPRRRKSVVDQVKDFAEGAGLGGIVGAVTGGRSRSRSRHRRGYDSDRYDRHSDRDRYDRRSRRYSSSSRSRSRGGHKSEKKWEQAAKAAIVAGAVEAFRSRKTPGSWTGDKGQRIATAALGAAGIDSLVDKNPDEHGKRHVAESAIGGLLANRLANGSRSQSRGRDRDGSESPVRSRSRSRSLLARARSFSRGRSQSKGRGGGGGNAIRDVAGAGAVLAAGKALYDRVRSKSRSRRDRSRSRSVSSEDSYVPSRRRRNNYDRGQSTDDYRSQQPANAERSLATTTASSGKGKGRLDSSDSESTTDMENQRKKMRVPQPYPVAYADANPYGGVPPPPIGAPPGARY